MLYSTFYIDKVRHQISRHFAFFFFQCEPLKGRVQKILFWKWKDAPPKKEEEKDPIKDIDQKVEKTEKKEDATPKKVLVYYSKLRYNFLYNLIVIHA